MPQYSLINVTKEIDTNTVEGYWIQDSIGSLEKAIGIAIKTNIANGNKLIIAIVPKVNTTTPLLNYFKDQNVITKI
jgi:hypothetical protein